MCTRHTSWLSRIPNFGLSIDKIKKGTMVAKGTQHISYIIRVSTANWQYLPLSVHAQLSSLTNLSEEEIITGTFYRKNARARKVIVKKSGWSSQFRVRVQV